MKNNLKLIFVLGFLSLNSCSNKTDQSQSQRGGGEQTQNDSVFEGGDDGQGYVSGGSTSGDQTSGGSTTGTGGSVTAGGSVTNTGGPGYTSTGGSTTGGTTGGTSGSTTGGTTTTGGSSTTGGTSGSTTTGGSTGSSTTGGTTGGSTTGGTTGGTGGGTPIPPYNPTNPSFLGWSPQPNFNYNDGVITTLQIQFTSLGGKAENTNCIRTTTELISYTNGLLGCHNGTPSFNTVSFKIRKPPYKNSFRFLLNSSGQFGSFSFNTSTPGSLRVENNGNENLAYFKGFKVFFESTNSALVLINDNGDRHNWADTKFRITGFQNAVFCIEQYCNK